MGQSSAIRGGIVVLTTSATTLVAAFFASYCAAPASQELRFLAPGRAPTLDEASVIIPIEYALRTSEPNDVILLGDSTCRHDVDPALLGVSAYNLGTMGMVGPQVVVMTLKAYLMHHAAPGAIVLCMSAYGFGQGNHEGEARGLGDRFVKTYGPTIGDDFNLSGMPLEVRRGAAALIHAPLKGLDVREVPFRDNRVAGETFTYRALRDRLIASRGYWALPEPMPNANYRRPRWKGEAIVVSPDWVAALPELADICRKCGAKFFVRATPIRSGEAHTKDWTTVERWLRQQKDAEVCAPVLQFWPRSLCWDHIHLNRRGVEKFSSIVAQDIERARGKREHDERQ